MNIKCPKCHAELINPTSCRNFKHGRTEMLEVSYKCECGTGNFKILYPLNDIEEQKYIIKQWNDHYSPEWW